MRIAHVKQAASLFAELLIVGSALVLAWAGWLLFLAGYL
jgi:TRAP-type C4-dicarboxylate transport system permease small subunit